MSLQIVSGIALSPILPTQNCFCARTRAVPVYSRVAKGRPHRLQAAQTFVLAKEKLSLTIYPNQRHPRKTATTRPCPVQTCLPTRHCFQFPEYHPRTREGYHCTVSILPHGRHSVAPGVALGHAYPEHWPLRVTRETHLEASPLAALSGAGRQGSAIAPVSVNEGLAHSFTEGDQQSRQIL